jgi:hypothetical protein
MLQEAFLNQTPYLELAPPQIRLSAMAQHASLAKTVHSRTCGLPDSRKRGLGQPMTELCQALIFQHDRLVDQGANQCLGAILASGGMPAGFAEPGIGILLRPVERGLGCQ